MNAGLANGVFSSYLIRWISKEYAKPEIIITENGWSDDGTLDDSDRIEYIREHLTKVIESIEDGCNVSAYTIWSVIDNFEWTSGYT